jgi:hypothetical protein
MTKTPCPGYGKLSGMSKADWDMAEQERRHMQQGVRQFCRILSR